MSKKDFGNPYLLSRIVDHFGIDEWGSNLGMPAYPASAFYERLTFRGEEKMEPTSHRGKVGGRPRPNVRQG
jgi:hypothetical protein